MTKLIRMVETLNDAPAEPGSERIGWAACAISISISLCVGVGAMQFCLGQKKDRKRGRLDLSVWTEKGTEKGVTLIYLPQMEQKNHGDPFFCSLFLLPFLLTEKSRSECELCGRTSAAQRSSMRFIV